MFLAKSRAALVVRDAGRIGTYEIAAQICVVLEHGGCFEFLVIGLSFIEEFCEARVQGLLLSLGFS